MKKRKRKVHKFKRNGRTYIVESHLELAFITEWSKQFPRNMPVTQFMFFPTRRWRFDFYWPNSKFALEIQGYGPGHTSREGMQRDAEKNNAAISMGMQVAYLTQHHLTERKVVGTCRYIDYLMRIWKST